MANPNSADNVAKKAQAKKLSKVMKDDVENTKARKAAKADKPGTAAEPDMEKSAGISLGEVAVDNLTPEWNEKLHDAIDLLGKGVAQSQQGWYHIGRTLDAIQRTFVKRGEDGEPLMTEKGEPQFDKKRYGQWLTDNGYDTGVIQNASTRSESIWLYRNWENVAGIPAVMKHGHPGHMHTAYRAFETAKANFLKMAEEGEEFDVKGWVQPKGAIGGGTVKSYRGAHFDGKAFANRDSYIEALDGAYSTALEEIRELKGSIRNHKTAIASYKDLIDILKSKLLKAAEAAARHGEEVDTYVDDAFLDEAPKAKRGRKAKALPAPEPKAEDVVDADFTEASQDDDQNAEAGAI